MVFFYLKFWDLSHGSAKSQFEVFGLQNFALASVLCNAIVDSPTLHFHKIEKMVFNNGLINFSVVHGM